MINGIPFPPKNQGDASIWETNNLPALEYCDLNRAANLLNCKVADLLHWAEIGAIELCLKFNAFRASIKSIDLNTKYRNNPNDWIKEKIHSGFLNKYTVNNHNQLGLLQLIPEPTKTNNNGSIEQKYCIEDRFPSPICHIFGLWGLISNPYDNLFSQLQSSEKVQVTALNLQLKAADEELTSESIRIQPVWSELFDRFTELGNPIGPAPDLFIITSSDFFITRKHIEQIDRYRGKLIPSYINGGVHHPESEDPIKEHGNVEASAAKREAVYQAAIYWLKHDPSACQGKRGELTIEAWAEKIISEKNHPKAKVTLGIDTVKQCLRVAMTGKN